MDAVIDKFEVFSAKVNVFFVVNQVAVGRITCIISLRKILTSLVS